MKHRSYLVDFKLWENLDNSSASQKQWTDVEGIKMAGEWGRGTISRGNLREVENHIKCEGLEVTFLQLMLLDLAFRVYEKVTMSFRMTL